MDNPAYAFGVFRKHFERARTVATIKQFVGLELGPGDSLSSAVIASSFGATAYYLVDVAPIADTAVEPYRRMTAYLAAQGFHSPNLDQVSSGDQALGLCHAQYLTEGLRSLKAIPSNSVDFIWSHVVIQLIKRAEFADYLRECRRILRPTGVCSHRVDLTDPMGKGLNHLRFSPRFWESGFVAGAGYYSNRLRYTQMLTCFREAGFVPTVTDTQRWSRLPVARATLWREFRDLPDEELLVSAFDVVLTAA